MLNFEIKCDISELNIHKDITAMHIQKAYALMCGVYFKYTDYLCAQQRRKTTQNWFLNRGSPC